MRRLIYLFHTTPLRFLLEPAVALAVAAPMHVPAPVLLIFGLLIVPSFVAGDIVVVLLLGWLRLPVMSIEALSGMLAIAGWTSWRPELFVPTTAAACSYCALMRASLVLVNRQRRPTPSSAV